MAATAQVGLEIAQHGVYPLELGRPLGFLFASDGRLASAACRGDRSEVGQPTGT